jgi:hypothetical protein
MKTLLLAGVLLASSSATALAQTDCTTGADGNTYCDPTAFHVSAPGATGQDPVLLNNSTSFGITEVGNHTINQPIRVFFIEPGSTFTAPTINEVSGLGSGGNFDLTGPFAFEQSRAWNPADRLFDGSIISTISTGQNLGAELNLQGLDASISFANFITAFQAIGLCGGMVACPTTFSFEDVAIPEGFNSDNDFMNFAGAFALGTIIAPVAVDVESQNNGHFKITPFDTSWTNTGVVNSLSSTVPEPQTWAMLVIGFGLMGLLGFRRKAYKLA